LIDVSAIFPLLTLPAKKPAPIEKKNGINA